MCHFLPVHHLRIAFLGRVEGQNITLKAITNMYSSESPTKSPEMLTHPFTLAKPASQSTGSSSCSLLPTAQFYRLVYSVPFSVLVSSVQLWDLPSLAIFWSRGRSRTQALCVGFVPKQIKGSSDWHLPTPTQRMPTSCHNTIKCFQLLLYNTNNSVFAHS